jgi:hypothetical protein
MRRWFWEVFWGFVAAVVLALGPPIAFLSIPAAGLFFFVVPIWIVGVVCGLFLLLLIFGRIPAAIGVAMLVIAVALSPVGQAALALINQIDQNAKQHAKDNAYIQRKLKECATTGYVPLKKPSAKYDLIVLDKIDMCGEQNYDIADTVAILTGMRVIVSNRVCFNIDHPGEVWETIAERSNSCVGERDSAKVGITPHLVQRNTAPLEVDVCLRRRKIPDPSGDRTPAIVLRSIPFGLGDCHATEVVERTASGDVELGRLHYVHQRYYPDLAVPEGISRYSWVLVLLSEILQQDLSDKALYGARRLREEVRFATARREIHAKLGFAALDSRRPMRATASAARSPSRRSWRRCPSASAG